MLFWLVGVAYDLCFGVRFWTVHVDLTAWPGGDDVDSVMLEQEKYWTVLDCSAFVLGYYRCDCFQMMVCRQEGSTHILQLHCYHEALDRNSASPAELLHHGTRETNNPDDDLMMTTEQEVLETAVSLG